jgi:hypothetical protein
VPIVAGLQQLGIERSQAMAYLPTCGTLKSGQLTQFSAFAHVSWTSKFLEIGRFPAPPLRTGRGASIALAIYKAKPDFLNARTQQRHQESFRHR